MQWGKYYSIILPRVFSASKSEISQVPKTQVIPYLTIKFREVYETSLDVRQGFKDTKIETFS